MFIGEYSHTIDAKGRLIVPSKFREQLGDEFVVTKGLDGCLFVYEILSGNLLRKSSTRFLLRMLMPESFRDFSWLVPVPVRWTGREGS